MRRLTVPACAAGAALAIAACGGSGHRPQARTQPERATALGTTIAVQTRTAATPAPPSPAQIRRAATLTAAEPGYRARISASIQLPQFNGNALTAVGPGYFDPRSSSGTLDLAIQLPGLLGLAGPLPTQVILAGGEAYVRVPDDLQGELASSDSWLQANPAQLDLDGSLSPSTILSQIARDATQAIPDQRATVTIDPASGLVKTIALLYSEPGGYRVRVELRFTGFEAEPAAAAPPASQVGDLIGTLRQLGF